MTPPAAKGKLDYSSNINDSLNPIDIIKKDATYKGIQGLAMRKSPFELLNPKSPKTLSGESSNMGKMSQGLGSPSKGNRHSSGGLSREVVEKLLEINNTGIGEIAGPMKGYKAMGSKDNSHDGNSWEVQSVKIPKKMSSRKKADSGSKKTSSGKKAYSGSDSLSGSGPINAFQFKAKKLCSQGRDELSNAGSVKSNLIKTS